MFNTWYLNFLGQEKMFFIFQNKVVKRGLVRSLFFYISLWKSLEVAGFAQIEGMAYLSMLLWQCKILKFTNSGGSGGDDNYDDGGSDSVGGVCSDGGGGCMSSSDGGGDGGCVGGVVVVMVVMMVLAVFVVIAVLLVVW